MNIVQKLIGKEFQARRSSAWIESEKILLSHFGFELRCRPDGMAAAVLAVTFF
jgi:hypothetical protein